MNLEPTPWTENPEAFTQEAVDTYILTITGTSIAIQTGQAQAGEGLESLRRLLTMLHFPVEPDSCH